jgi:hypothetical protein
MQTRRESCRTCKYFAASFADGPAEGDTALGECVNSESDYEHRTVDAAFHCEFHEPRNEA